VIHCAGNQACKLATAVPAESPISHVLGGSKVAALPEQRKRGLGSIHLVDNQACLVVIAVRATSRLLGPAY
jgi:hypothetical protein